MSDIFTQLTQPAAQDPIKPPTQQPGTLGTTFGPTYISPSLLPQQPVGKIRVQEPQTDQYAGIVARAMAANPALYRTMRAKAEKAGLFVDDAIKNPVFLEEVYQEMEMARQDFRLRSPHLANLLHDQNFARAAADDAVVMAQMEGSVSRWIDALFDPYRNLEQAGIAARRIAGTDTDQDKLRLAYLQKLARRDALNDGPMTWIMQQVGRLGYQLPISAAGLATGPAAPWVIGAGVGSLGAAEEFGSAYNMARDVDGLSSEDAAWSASIQAAGVGLLESAVPAVGSKLAKPLIQTALKSGIRSAMQEQATKPLLEGLKAFGKVAGGEVVTEDLQTLHQHIVRNYFLEKAGKAELAADWEQIGRDLVQTTLQTMTVMAVFGGATGLSVYGSAQRQVETAKRDQKAFTDLANNVQDLKSVKDAPDLLHRHLASTTKGTNAEHLYVRAGKLRELLAEADQAMLEQQAQEAGMTLEEYLLTVEDKTPETTALRSILPDVVRQLDEATTDEVDVLIPTADYAVSIAGNKEFNNSLKPHLRSTADGASFAESIEVAKQVDQFVNRAMAAVQAGQSVEQALAPEQETNEIAELRKEIRTQLEAIPDLFKTDQAIDPKEHLTTATEVAVRVVAGVARATGSTVQQVWQQLGAKLSFAPMDSTAGEGTLASKAVTDTTVFASTGEAANLAEFDLQRLRVILSKNATINDFVHELGHFYMRSILRVVTQEGATTVAREDALNLLSWFGIEGTTLEEKLAKWNSMSLDEQRPHDEAFADNLSLYMETGQAPTEQTRSLFSRVSRFIRQTYRNLRAFLNERYKANFGKDLPTMSPEIKRFMDRMLASEDQIVMAEKVRGLAELFKPEIGGDQTAAEFAAVEELRRLAEDEAIIRFMVASQEAHDKALQMRGAELQKQLRQEAQQEVENLPTNKARVWAKSDKANRISSASIKALFEGQGGLELGRWGKISHMVSSQGGMDVNVVAEMFGYPDAMAFVNDLLDGKSIDDQVQEVYEQKVREAIAEALPDAYREDLITEAIHNDARLLAVATEVRNLMLATQIAGDLADPKVQEQRDAASAQLEQKMAERDALAMEIKQEVAALRKEQKANNKKRVAQQKELRKKKNELRADLLSKQAEIRDIRASAGELNEEKRAMIAALEVQVKDLRTQIKVINENIKKLATSFEGKELTEKRKRLTRLRTEVTNLLNKTYGVHTSVRILRAAAKEAARQALLTRKVGIVAPQSVVNETTGKRNRPSSEAQHYERAAAKAATEAAKAQKAGDWLMVMRFKQSELINSAMAQEASKRHSEIKAGKEKLQDIATAKRTVGESRDYTVVQYLKTVLQAFGLPAKIESAVDPLAYTQAQAPAIYERGEALKRLGINNLDDLTVEQFQELLQFATDGWKYSRQMRVSTLEDQEMDLAELDAKVAAEFEGLTPEVKARERGRETRWEIRFDKLMSFVARFKRIEQWALGKSKYIHSILVQPVMEAQNLSAKRSREAIAKLNEIISGLQFANREKIFAEKLNYTFGRDSNNGLLEVWIAMLNMGNEQNYSRMITGFNKEFRNEDGSLNDVAWQEFIQELLNSGQITEKHLQALQQVWDLLDEYFEGAQETHMRLTGYPARLVERKPVTFRIKDKDGTVREVELSGGYVPIRYNAKDLAKRLGTEPKTQVDDIQNATNEAGRMLPFVPKSYMKERAEGDTNMLLNFSHLSLLTHLDQLIRYTHVQPVLSELNRLFERKDSLSRAALDRLDPVFYNAAYKPWLASVAQNAVQTGERSEFLDFIRNNAAMSKMMFNPSNVLQQFTGLFLSATKVPYRYLWLAMRNYLTGDANELAAAIRSKSAEMDSRLDSQMRENIDQLRDLVDKKGAIRTMQAWTNKNMYLFQTKAQNMIDIITWWGAYNHYLASTDGATEQDAVRHADTAVRVTQGSFRASDLSAIEKGSAFWRIFTQFTGYFNMMINLNVMNAQEVFKKAKIDARLPWQTAMAQLFNGWIFPIIVSEAIVKAMSDQPWFDDDDEIIDDITDFFVLSQVRTLLGAFPVGGGIAYQGFVAPFTDVRFDDNPRQQPTLEAMSNVARLLSNTGQLFTEERADIHERNMRQVIDGLTVATGLPFSAIMKPLRFLTKAAQGEIDVEPTPMGALGFARGVLTGKPSKEQLGQ